MLRITAALIFLFCTATSYAQEDLVKEIKNLQLDRFYDEACLDFVRERDLAFGDKKVQQIIIVRHGEPAMDKKGWRDRDGAIRYTEMYDSVGVYPFDDKPLCLRDNDVDTAFTSCLPRAMDTAEKTLGEEFPKQHLELFNEFERQIIKFPNWNLPMKFWSITTRVVWMMGFNHSQVESFGEAKKRARDAADFLDEVAQEKGKALLFSHGFLNRYIKRYLKKNGYKAVDLDGQKYLGAYYFYKIN